MLQHTQKTAASLERHPASRGLAVAPRPTHTAALLCPRRITGAVPNSASGERCTLASRGRIARSPGWRRIVKKWKSLHCTCTNARAAVHPSLHDTGTNSVPTHVLLHDTYRCRHLLLCTYSASGGRREAWRGKNRHAGPALAWFGVQLLLSFGAFFLSAMPSPALAQFRVFLLYSRCTIIVHTCWVRGLLDVFFLLRAVLCYYRTAYCCCTAVVRGGWVDRFVGVSMGSWVFFHFVICFPRYTDPALV